MASDDANIDEKHIHYAMDEEASAVGGPRISRQFSTSSQFSLHNLQYRRGSTDPTHALPIQFRTVSIQLDESKKSPLVEAEEPIATVEIVELEWHRIALDELYRRLSTSRERGLAAEQVQRRIMEYGPNSPSPPPSRLLRDIAGYFFEGFGSILLLGGILVFICWKPLGDPPASANLALAIVLLIVFFLQGAFNAWQHWSSSKIMASITTMLPDRCLVVRDGNQTEISAPEVVPGTFFA
ncbi:ATPase Na K transporting alpha [Lobaria immixta]|nr:ATPase Na K transporting alpha [Lobaria immixta]